MTIKEKHVYRSTALPSAPERATREEAEADEARGVELAAYLAILPTLTEEQWEKARDAARDAARGAARDTACGAAWGAARDAARGAARDTACGAAWGAAWDTAWDTAWGAARDTAWDTAWGAARDAARGAAWGAVAIVVRDLIAPEHFDILTAPMRAAGIDFDKLGQEEQS